MTRALTLAAFAAALTISPAFAQQQPAGTAGRPNTGTANAGSATAAKAPVNDTLFVAAAANSGMAEVSISELGVQKSKDADLRKFSQQMIDEHGKMNSDLMALAGQKRVAVPRGIDPCSAFCAQSLAGLSGEEFDRCYAKAQCLAHEASLAIFEAEAERGRDPEIKALAAKGVTHIRDHLKTIKPIAERLGKGENKDSK